MRNRWLIALAAIGIHISIGSVYAWSVLTRPIMNDMGFTLSQTTWAFSIAIVLLGLSAGFLGSFAERIGPKKSGLLSTLCFGVGLLGTAYALSIQSLPLLYLCYGVIGGIGLGIGYITPVSTLVKYFPNRPGFATGLAIMGFGFASLISGPVMQYLVEKVGLIYNFLILGLVYMVIMGLSSLYLKPPTTLVQAGAEMVKSSSATQGNQTDSKEGNGEAGVGTIKDEQGETPTYVSNLGMTAKDAVRTWQFGALWWMFLVNITCGIALLAVASPMAQEVIGMTPTEAASMVGVIGMCNGIGRIAWSTISDYIGRGMTYILFFFIEMAACYALAFTTEVLVFQGIVLLIISCYGGGFACIPAYLADLYGVRQLSTIHGWMLTAWSVAGVAGPMMISYFKEMGYGYSTTLQFFAGLFVLNLIIAVMMKQYGQRCLGRV